MKITKEILRNIIKEELEGVLNEMLLNEQERSALKRFGDRLAQTAKGAAKPVAQAIDRFASTQSPRYKSRAQAQAALDKAGDAPGTDSMKKDLARAFQQAARNRTDIQRLKTRIGHLEAEAGMDPGNT